MPSSTAMLSGLSPTRVKLVLARGGYKCDVYRASDDGSEDVLNNSPSGSTSWSKVGTTLAALFHNTENDETREGDAPRDSNAAFLCVPPSSIVQDEDRVDYNGKTFRLDAETDHDHYRSYSVREVQERTT